MDERDLIEKLRMRVKNILTGNMYDDTMMFYRFLKSRKFDVDAAEKMIRKHLIWRKLNQVDTISEDFKPDEYYTRYIDPTILGFCKEGSLVIYVPMGKLETKDVLKCSQLNRYKRHYVWLLDKIDRLIRQQVETSGTNIYKMTMITNADKLTFGNATHRYSADVLLYLVNLFQDNYPGGLKALYIINAPTYALIVVNLIQAIISNTNLKRIHMFGNDGWKEKLLEAIDANVLPAFLGGNRTDPNGNPLCKTFVKHGGEFSSEYFLSDEERYFENRPGVEKVTIPKMDKKEIGLEVKGVGSTIKWEFYSKSSVIFGLNRELSEQNQEEVIPLSKYYTFDGTEKNSYKVRIPGKYILVFDNSLNWLTSKEVEYRFEVLKRES